MAVVESALEKFGITSSPAAVWIGGELASRRTGEAITVRSPIDGRTLATIKSATPADVNRAIDAAADAFVKWREVPAPKRGEFVRRHRREAARAARPTSRRSSSSKPARSRRKRSAKCRR